MALRLSILGVTGRMGRRVLSLAANDPQFCVVGGSSRTPFTPSVGDLIESPALVAPLSSDVRALLSQTDVAIDFSLPESTSTHLAAALEMATPLVIGTTGHTPLQLQEIERAAQSIPILFSPNFSLAVASCMDVVGRLYRALPEGTTVKIIESHHIHKKDRPSKTALTLADATGCSSVAIESIRSGEIIGEHTILFECPGERIELKHTALSRDIFAKGALSAAAFLAGKPPGLYTLQNML